MNPATKFEEDLKVFFPDIYKLHQLGKWDRHLWETIYTMLEMSDKSTYGDIRIVYQAGKINRVLVTNERSYKHELSSNLVKIDSKDSE